MDLREVFAANLRRLRHERRLSQDDLAYEAEVSRSYLSQLEKGSYYASLKILGKLATVLNVEPSELLKLPESRDQRRGTDQTERGSAIGRGALPTGDYLADHPTVNAASKRETANLWRASQAAA